MRAPEFWTQTSISARLKAALLSPFSAFYAGRTRRAQRKAKAYRARARVVCVGNLTAGGSGKTPVALALGRMLAEGGARIVFLTRGYGGRNNGPLQVHTTMSAREIGDEALLLAQEGTTIVARDRAAGAAMADFSGADVIVMDDGFQNFSLEKDLSFVVVDGETGFGNGHVIPAGPLREPVATGLKRADAVIIVGDGTPDLKKYSGPVLRARIKPQPRENLRGRSFVAFSGIGRPEKFFQTLTACGATLRHTRAFPDHHRFRKRELRSLLEKARELGAQLITTEKDFVRLPPAFRGKIATLPVTLSFDDAAAVEGLLDRILASSDSPAA